MSPQPDMKPLLNVILLIVGEPQAPELWTFKKLAELPCALHIVRAEKSTSVAASKRLKRLCREHGIWRVASRLLGTRIFGALEGSRQQRYLDQLFDGENLRRWWKNSGITIIDVPHLNHADARAAIAALRPDIIVRVSGGILRREIFSLAHLATLNIHHGQAPQIRGMWSIPWGIVEGRREWIGATVHIIDDGIDTGSVLWRGAPQLAPGDCADDLFFRVHLEAVDALIQVINDYARGNTPALWPCDSLDSVYRTAPGLSAWLRYLYWGRGARSPVILERAVKW